MFMLPILVVFGDVIGSIGGWMVADINPYLWSDLFLANRENVLQELAAFSQQLERWREALTAADAQLLQEMMREAAIKRKDLY